MELQPTSEKKVRRAAGTEKRDGGGVAVVGAGAGGVIPLQRDSMG